MTFGSRSIAFWHSWPVRYSDVVNPVTYRHRYNRLGCQRHPIHLGCRHHCVGCFFLAVHLIWAADILTGKVCSVISNLLSQYYKRLDIIHDDVLEANATNEYSRLVFWNGTSRKFIESGLSACYE